MGQENILLTKGIVRMANITKRTNKDGSASYLIRIYVDETGTGHQVVKSMTWRPSEAMRPTTAEKEANRQALLFEDQVKRGLASFAESTKFEDYGSAWVENEPMAFKTRERYLELLKRINAAMGHIKLEKLQAHHLEAFYKNLAETGVNERERYAVSDKQFDNIMKSKKLSRATLGKLAGLSASTVSTAARGEKVNIETAEKLCAALETKVSDLFVLHENTSGLSDKTILHHHRLISAILEKAKRERLIPYNVAREHATAPKVQHKEAAYLDDEQARDFLALLLNEDDIRAKTALILLLFTGARRGELCGLSWPDIDVEKNIINIVRASQYQSKQGIVEVPTKNTSSIRAVKVPAFVFELLGQYRTWWNEKRLLFGKDWQGKEQRLFIQEEGKPINPDTINFWMNKFISKHHIEHITPHGLRHTFATLQISAGVDIRTLQARTGHAQASTLVNIYSHAIKSAQEAASTVLDNILLSKKKID
jgi:integrase